MQQPPVPCGILLCPGAIKHALLSMFTGITRRKRVIRYEDNRVLSEYVEE